MIRVRMVGEVSYFEGPSRIVEVRVKEDGGKELVVWCPPTSGNGPMIWIDRINLRPDLAFLAEKWAREVAAFDCPAEE